MLALAEQNFIKTHRASLLIMHIWHILIYIWMCFFVLFFKEEHTMNELTEMKLSKTKHFNIESSISTGMYHCYFLLSQKDIRFEYSATEHRPSGCENRKEVESVCEQILSLKAQTYEKLVESCKEDGEVEEIASYYCESENYNYWLKLEPNAKVYSATLCVYKKPMVFAFSIKDTSCLNYVRVEAVDEKEAIKLYGFYYFNEVDSGLFICLELSDYLESYPDGLCVDILKEDSGITEAEFDELEGEEKFNLRRCGVCHDYFHKQDLTWVSDHNRIPYKNCCPMCVEIAQSDMESYYQRVQNGTASEDY